VANSPSLIQKNVSLADFLASAVASGTQSQVFVTEKTDAAGQEADAVDIAESAGSIWSNGVDDAFLCAYALNYKSTKLWIAADATERDAFGSDDDLAVNDLCYLVSTTGISYCVSVDGGSASTWAAIAATGSVAGPGASTDHAVMRWDGAGGATAQNSVVIVSDLGAISGVTDITLSGTIDGRNVSTDGATLDAHVASIANPHSTLLSQTLAAGNQTDGNSIEISLGDEIYGIDGGHFSFAAGTGLIEFSEAECDADLSVLGLVENPTGLVLSEQASSPFTAAAKQTLWAKSTIPSTLWTTDDAGNDYQVATGTTFSLATTLVIGNLTGANDILVTSGQALRGAPGSAGTGGAAPIIGGTGDGSGNAGGVASLTGGLGSAHAGGGAGGAATVAGGAGGTTSGAGGAASLRGGAGTAGVSAGGLATVAGGAPSGAAAPGAVAITAANAVSGNVIGAAVSIDAGNGFGTQAGGVIAAAAGDGGATGAGGMASLSGGAGGATSGAGGGAFVVGGAAQSAAGGGAGGEAACLGGAGAGAGAGGTARLQGGAGGGLGDGGLVRVRAGASGPTGGTGGAAELTGGEGTLATATGGAVSVTGGAAGSGAATGGAIAITSGAGGGTSGNSGAITIASGAIAVGTRGVVTIDASTINFTATADVAVTNHSYHSVRGSTARGAVNTLIYRWTSVSESTGPDITYTDSANNGGSWAINTIGMYCVSCSIDVNHNGYIAIKKAAALSNTFDETTIMVAVEAIAGNTVTATWTGFCAVNDDIWISTSSATNPTGTPVNNNRVSVVRVR
jgi:hypothetical protein